MKKSVVLLSAGLDSTVNLFEAKTRSEVILALTFDYGQRAAPRERTHAAKIASAAGVPHRIIDLPFFMEFTKSSLLNRSEAVPVKDSVSIDDYEVSTKTAKAVWVPNRNGIMLNIAAGFAEGLGAEWIVPGFNAEEAVTFPDNSDLFLRSLSQSFFYSTSNHLEATCFTTGMNKTAIVRRGKELGVPFDLIWPCYFAAAAPCGECESCQRFKRAMTKANK